MLGIGEQQGEIEGFSGHRTAARNPQGHHRHIGPSVRAHQCRVRRRDGGNARRIGLQVAEKIGTTRHLGQVTRLVKLDGATVTLAQHLPRQQATAIKIGPEGEGAATGRGVEGGAMPVIEKLHTHLHHRLHQFGGVIGHHGDKQGVTAGATAHRLGIGGHVLPASRWGLQPRLTEQGAVGEREPHGEVPGHGDLGPVLAGRLPDPGQVGVGGASRQEGAQVPQTPFAGQIGAEQWIEIHQIRSRAGEDRRQKLAFHRTPRHVGPANPGRRIGPFPFPDGLTQKAIEAGRQIQGPDTELARRRPPRSRGLSWRRTGAGGQQGPQDQGKPSQASPAPPPQPPSAAKLSHAHSPSADGETTAAATSKTQAPTERPAGAG